MEYIYKTKNTCSTTIKLDIESNIIRNVEFTGGCNGNLNQIDLTYTQYITMLALWEYGQLTVKELGECLYLDSGTLTPLLKKLESKGLIIRKRSNADERVINVSLTEKGLQLREKAVSIPESIGSCVNLTQEEMLTLYRLLYKILGKEL